MTSRTRIVIIASLLLFSLLPPALLFAQTTVQWKIPLIIRGGTKSDTVWFGYHPNATGCPLSAALKFADCDTLPVFGMPPPTPPGPLDVRFSECPSIADNGMNYGFHASLPSAPAVDSFMIKLLPQLDDAGNKLKYYFSWPANMSDFFTTASFEEYVNGKFAYNMLTVHDTSYQPTRFEASTTVAIFVSGPKVKTLPVPATPTLTPANTTNGADTASTTLSWTAAANATVYHFAIADNPGMSSPLVNIDTTGLTYTVRHLKAGTKYYWKVQARSAFLSGCAAQGTFITYRPFKPVSPSGGALNVPVPATLKWSNAFATSYNVQISRDGFTSLVKDTVMTDTSIIVLLDHCTTFQWKVKAHFTVHADTTIGPSTFSTVAAVPSVPVQTAPPNNANNQTSPTVAWKREPCAQSYTVIVMADTTTIDTLLKASVTDTSKVLPPLFGETDYYWKVNAVGSLGNSEYSPWWKFRTGVLPPLPPNLLGPANDTLYNDLSATLVWSKPANNPTGYRIQVDTSASFTAPLIDNAALTDTSFTVSLHNCTQYYWRVLGKNTAGTGQYSATGRFRVVDLAPATPTQLTPALNATVPQLQATLTWSYTDWCSKRFIVWFGPDSARFPAPDTVTGTSRQVSNLTSESDYYWKIAAWSSAGASAPSPVWKFTTGVVLPTVPSLLSPADAAVINPDGATFTWRQSANKARTYHFQVDGSATFPGVTFIDTVVADTSITLTKNFIHCFPQYSWRVNATNPAGTTVWSPVRSFSLQNTVPAAPTLISPRNGQDSIPETPTFSWSGDLCTDSYEVILSKDENFGSTVWSITAPKTTTQASIDPLKLDYSTTYYWKVTGKDELGPGAATVYHFKTTSQVTPHFPVLRYPTNGAGNVELNPIFRWDSSYGAATYRLQVAHDSNFTSLWFDDSTNTTLVKQVTLLNSTSYYWRMNAKNKVGTSDWSTPVFMFRTLAPPAPPQVIYPLSDSINIGLRPTFSWTKPDGGSYYTIEIAADTGFKNILASADSLVDQSYYCPVVLKQRHWYYWHVRAGNLAGWGAFIPTTAFKTAPVDPARWSIPLTVAETGPAHDVIRFGVNPDATAGIDINMNEFEMPQISSGVFDARFVDPPTRLGFLGEGVRTDIDKFYNFRKVDTFRVVFQPGTGSYPMTFNWSRVLVSDICDSMLLTDEWSGNFIHVRMDKESTATVTNPQMGSLLIIEWAMYPLGVLPPPQVTASIPHGYMLYQNYPNPFNPTTSIAFSSEYPANVRLAVYDVLGREVALLANAVYSPGLHEVVWNGKSDRGQDMPSGVYYARALMTRLSAGEPDNDRYSTTRKMLMIK